MTEQTGYFHSCRKCHEKFSGKQCPFCKRAAIKRWKQANPDKARQYYRKWRASHREQHNAYQREYVRRHPEKRTYERLKRIKEEARKQRTVTLEPQNVSPSLGRTTQTITVAREDEGTWYASDGREYPKFAWKEIAT